MVFNTRNLTTAIDRCSGRAVLSRRGDGGTGGRGDCRLSTRGPQPSTRGGFTLIEMMVVITVIAILASMITVAGLGFVQRARIAATRTTIKKVDEAILNRTSAIDRFQQLGYDRLRESWKQRGWISRWANYGLSPQILRGRNSRSQRILMLLSRKEAMKEMFPLTWSELNKCYWFWGMFEVDGVPGFNGPQIAAEINARNQYLADHGLREPANPPNERNLLDRPGEVFLYSLKNAPVFGGLPMTADDFTEKEVTDPDEDGVPQLCDAFQKNPLRFYRWPTRLVNFDNDWDEDKTTADEDGNIEAIDSDALVSEGVPRQTLMQTLLPNAPASNELLKRDPDDPLAYLARIQLDADTTLSEIFHDRYTWHAPLIVSAGPDATLGLAEPDEPIDKFDPVTVNLPSGSVTFPRYGLAEPTAANTRRSDTLQERLSYLFDNVTNHNGTGGL